jgi:hypothetical protein
METCGLFSEVSTRFSRSVCKAPASPVCSISLWSRPTPPLTVSNSSFISSRSLVERHTSVSPREYLLTEKIMTKTSAEPRELRDDELEAVSGGLVVIAIIAVLIPLFVPDPPKPLPKPS